MKLTEIMTNQVHVIPPTLRLRDCAMRMRELDVGALPICANDRIVGIVTDRDLVTKALATGLAETDATVREVMSSPVVYAYEDEEISAAAHLMETQRIRRLIVLNRQKRLVGIVSLGDLAVRGDQALPENDREDVSRLSAEALRKVCAKRALGDEAA